MIRRAVTIRPEGFAAPPQRNDANRVTTTRRGFDDGARGANGKLVTTGNRKHAGTIGTQCAQGAPIVEEIVRERALRIAPILADELAKFASSENLGAFVEPSRCLGKEMHIIKYT